MESRSKPVDDLFANLIEALEEDPKADLDAFLAGHPEHAAALRERLERLRGAGLLGSSWGDGSLLHEMRARFGVRSEVKMLRPPSPAEASEHPEELLPSRIVGGRYRIIGELGRGGMGRVFRALDVDLEREVALKVANLDEILPHADAAEKRAWIERFLAEAQVTAQLEHPSIVPLHDIGVDRTGQLYYTMKVVDGRTLARCIDEWHAALAAGRPFPTAECLRIVQQICNALAFAHERGVVHRDLKPSNVMVGRFGEVQVMDWGLAKLLGGQEASVLPIRSARTDSDSPTLAGQALGTPPYMAPEQTRGDPSAVDRRADIYGVGAILFHALWGRPPDANTGERRTGATVQRPLGPPVPKELRAICTRALEPDPAARYCSISEMSADLEAFLHWRKGSAWRDGPFRRLTKIVRRKPATWTAVFGGTALALVITVAVGLIAAQRRRTELEQQQAKLANERAESERELRMIGNLTSLLTEKQAEWNARELGIGRDEVPAVLEIQLADFRQADFPLDGPEPVEEVLARLARIRAVEPDLATRVANQIEGLASNAEMAQLPVAARFCAGTLDRPITKNRERWTRWCEQFPDLLRFLPRLDVLADGVVEDPWRESVWEAFRARNRDLKPYPDGLLTTMPEDPADIGFLAMKLAADPELRVRRRAFELLELCVASDAENFWAHFLLGYFKGGDFPELTNLEEAIEHAYRAVTIGPRAFRAWSNLGSCLIRAERDAEALVALRRSVQLMPEDSLAQGSLGEALRRAGRLPEALQALDRSLELAPSPKQFFNRALLHRDLDHQELAEADLRRALELDPGYAKAWYNLAAVLDQLGRMDEAADALDKALELEPGLK